MDRFGGEFQQYRDTERCRIPQVSKTQPLQDEMRFFLGERTVFVGGADPAMELCVAAEPFFDPGHADEDQGYCSGPALSSARDGR